MIRTILTATALAVVMPITGAAAAGDMPTPKWMSTPCEYEDSPNCYWNAEVAGNGDGHSFYSITAWNAKHTRLLQCTIYAQTRYGKKHNTCQGN